ncbi:MAG: hypothetical protein KKF93_04420 [Candidatus Omnitrophica bacterium]|nr:hypothetical protein [Candidatus Omnitrophota bacterium]
MTSKKSKTKPIGQILIEKKLIMQEQLDKALEVQVQEGGLLGQILVKLGFISQESLDVNLYEQADSAQRLENALVEMGFLNKEQVNKIFEFQKKEGGLISKIIVQLGFLSEEDLVSAMVTQYGFPYLKLEDYQIDPEIVKLVPEKAARKHYLVPIDKIGNILTVAMADPLNATAQADIRKITGLNVETFISTFSDIDQALENYYSKK